MDRSRDVDLLLLGKTGNGKSKTGNTILGRRAFVSSTSSTSVTTDICSEVAEYDGRCIKVVDGPGVGDTRLDNEAAMKLVMKEMARAIAMNDKGYHAFLLVVRFGGRFTKEDKEAVDFLKTIFGPDCVRNYCILLLTCGDNFAQESEESGQSFQGWCREQKGVLRELMDECGDRVVLFDNMTKDTEKKKSQMDQLITMVDNLQSHGQRYNDKNFAKARAARERLMIEAKEPLIRQETMEETSLILHKLEQIHKIVTPQEQAGPLQELQKRCDALYENIKSLDKGTGALHKLAETVVSIRGTVQSENEVCKRMIAEEENLKKQGEKFKEERERLQKELEQQREQIRREMEQRRKELEQSYRQVKQNNEGKILDTVLTIITAPLVALASRCVIS